MDSDSAAISLAFLISLSITFAILMLILVVIAAYVTFCGDDESEYDEENALGTRTSGTLHSLFGKNIVASCWIRVLHPLAGLMMRSFFRKENLKNYQRCQRTRLSCI